MTKSKASRATNVKHRDPGPWLAGRDGVAALVGLDISKHALDGVRRWSDGRFARPFHAANPGRVGAVTAVLHRLAQATDSSGVFGDPLAVNLQML
jgi:hypothetical protein